jgi:hypothetical protein
MGIVEDQQLHFFLRGRSYQTGISTEEQLERSITDMPRGDAPVSTSVWRYGTLRETECVAHGW